VDRWRFPLVRRTGGGYAVASQPGAIFKRRAMEIDYRTFDKSGRQTFSGIEYGKKGKSAGPPRCPADFARGGSAEAG
jgi:hypothetical protein